MFESLTAGRVNTIVAMHLGEEHRKEAEKNHLNVVIAGHIARDNVGINRFLMNYLVVHQHEILECSGFKESARVVVEP